MATATLGLGDFKKRNRRTYKKLRKMRGFVSFCQSSVMRSNISKLLEKLECFLMQSLYLFGKKRDNTNGLPVFLSTIENEKKNVTTEFCTSYNRSDYQLMMPSFHWEMTCNWPCLKYTCRQFTNCANIARYVVLMRCVNVLGMLTTSQSRLESSRAARVTWDDIVTNIPW